MIVSDELNVAYSDVGCFLRVFVLPCIFIFCESFRLLDFMLLLIVALFWCAFVSPFHVLCPNIYAYGAKMSIGTPRSAGGVP